MKRGGVLLALATAALMLGIGVSPGHGAGETITVEDSIPQKSLDRRRIQASSTRCRSTS
jgi:hypothetical protein